MKIQMALAGLGVAQAKLQAPPPPQPTIIRAYYEEYDRTKNARCSGISSGLRDCYVAPDGGAYRYGCMEGDDRVLMEACGVGSCDVCSGIHKFANERVGVCYDDGNNLYQYFCGDHAYVHSPANAAEQDEEAREEDNTKTCSQLGWPLQPGDLDVCGHSMVDEGKCAVASTWAEANDMCEAMGARLCTARELRQGEAKGTGCQADCKNVWTNDRCAGGHISSAGAAKCLKRHPATCLDDQAPASVRCCADAKSNAELSYPKGFSPAVSLEYRVTDGACGAKEPIRQYSCWTNPADQQSIRFACALGSDLVYYQFCGSDSSCSSESCSGEWSKTGEFSNQCYTRAAEGYLYEYKCPRN